MRINSVNPYVCHREGIHFIKCVKYTRIRPIICWSVDQCKQFINSSGGDEATFCLGNWKQKSTEDGKGY